MPGPMHGFGRGYLTEEEKANRPKVTWPLLKRVFSWLAPYKFQMFLVIAAITRSIWNLYGASQEKTRFRSGQVTFGRLAFSSSVR